MKILGILSDHRAWKSKSPAMQTAVMRRLGLEGVYLPFEVAPDQVGPAVRGLRALGIAGANVTVPYKEAVIPFLDDLAAEAAAMGAVNTIVVRNGRLEGHNTDASGFCDALDSAGYNPAGRTAMVFGAGGAAKAVVFALKTLGAAKIILAGRNFEKISAAALALDVESRPFTTFANPAPGVHLAINASSVSSRLESEETAAFVYQLDFPDLGLVLDLNYGRRDNFWRDLAEKHRADFMDGLPMLAFQARRSFHLWTGLDPDPGLFLSALKEAV
ncbi:MAG: shikimate dehydrogenase [Pseudomonadota bacterium]